MTPAMITSAWIGKRADGAAAALSLCGAPASGLMGSAAISGRIT
jgi:hypothetical protein